jgi:hypothetical protein
MKLTKEGNASPKNLGTRARCFAGLIRYQVFIVGENKMRTFWKNEKIELQTLQK